MARLNGQRKRRLLVRCLGGGAAQRETDKDAEPHKYCFPFSVHDDSPFRFLCAVGKQHNTEALGRSPDYSLEKSRGTNEADCTVGVSLIVFCGAGFTGVTWSAPSVGHR